jgi:hypothetical protein
MTISLILLVFAFVLFLLSAFGVGAPRFNLLAGGLACWVLSILLSGSHLLK